MIDDLVTKGIWRTISNVNNRAEYRLLIHHDNADERLIKYGHDVGLVSDEIYQKYLDKMDGIFKEIEGLIIFAFA